MELRKSPSLQSLNIVDCKAIDEELMQSLVDPENWVSLEELKIGGNKIPDSADDFHIRYASMMWVLMFDQRKSENIANSYVWAHQRGRCKPWVLYG